MFLVTSLALGSCLRENNVCLLEGTTVFDDQLAASFADYEKISCSTGPCKLDLPGDRVIPAVTTLSGVTVEGGTAFFDCGGTSNFEADSVTGKISISGCSSVSIHNSMVDADITTDSEVRGNLLSGSTLRLGSSGIGAGIGVEHGTATLQLSGGRASLYGDMWKIEGTGSVNIDNTRKVEYESGTEGITMLSWKWLEKHAEVVLQKFANKPGSPVLFHKQNVTVMQNGWINGSSVTDSVVTGAVDYVPKIIGSRVSSDARFSTDSVSDSVLDVTLYSRYEPLFFNNVSGKVSVATHVEFVNVWVPEGQTLDLTGPYSVDCPKCNRTFHISERPSEPTDLFAPHLGAVGNIDLQGKTLVIGHTQTSLKPTARRSRRTTYPVSCTEPNPNIHKGHVVLTAQLVNSTTTDCHKTSFTFYDGTLESAVIRYTSPHPCGYLAGAYDYATIDTDAFVSIYIDADRVNLTNVDLTGDYTILLDVHTNLVLNGVRNANPSPGTNVYDSAGNKNRKAGMLAVTASTLTRQDLKIWTSSVSANYYNPNSNTYTPIIEPNGYQNGQIRYTILGVCNLSATHGLDLATNTITSTAQHVLGNFVDKQNLTKLLTENPLNPKLECGPVCLISLEKVYNNSRICDPELLKAKSLQGSFTQCLTHEEGTVVGPFFDPHTIFTDTSVDFKRLRNAGFGTNTSNTSILGVFTTDFRSTGYNCYGDSSLPSCVVYNYVPNPMADHTITLQYGDNFNNYNPSLASELYYVFLQVPTSITIKFIDPVYAKIYLLFNSDPGSTRTLKVTTTTTSINRLEVGCGVINSNSSLAHLSPTSINSTDMSSHFRPVSSGLTVIQTSEYGKEYSNSGGYMPMEGYHCDMSTSTGTSSVSSSSGDGSTSEPEGSTTQSSGSSTSKNEDIAIIIGSVVGGLLLIVIGYKVYKSVFKRGGSSRPVEINMQEVL